MSCLGLGSDGEEVGTNRGGQLATPKGGGRLGGQLTVPEGKGATKAGTAALGYATF
jgi:hypothetical protein